MLKLLIIVVSIDLVLGTVSTILNIVLFYYKRKTARIEQEILDIDNEILEILNRRK